MTQIEQIDAFNTELDNLLDRFADEFEICYAGIIGVLTLKAQQLGLEAISMED